MPIQTFAFALLILTAGINIGFALGAYWHAHRDGERHD